MTTINFDQAVANLLKATLELTAGTGAAIRAGTRKAITKERGGTLIRWECDCSRAEAEETRAWLRSAATAMQGTNAGLARELLIAADRDLLPALTAPY
jgi:hypothetical protein